MNDIIIGIDLGTTNSEVAVVQNGKVVVIEEANGHKILPSFVGIGDNGEILVGQPAKNQYALYPERTVKSIKRRMGEDVTVDMAGQDYSPQEISAIILKRLKAIAEDYLGQPVRKAVITVPAYFSDTQRQATREAGEIAGLEVVRMINEPTAAALSYESDQKDHKRVLVYDLGGGTFDVSVVNIENDVVEVISSHGNNHLGGDDFDHEIVAFLLEHMRETHAIELKDSRKAVARLTRAAEQAKLALSDEPYVRIEEEYLAEKNGKPVHLSLELSRHTYEAMIESYLDETLEAVHIALKDANLTASDIDKILLVGGSTRTPAVRQRLHDELGVEAHSDIHPDLCVATGAAIQAALIGGAQVSTVLVDVTPYTYGTSAIGEVDGERTPFMYVPIIRKNSPLPVGKSEVFFTMRDGQRQVDVKIYQGEDPDALNNILIGQFTVEGLQDVPEGNPILITLNLDLNGVLQVSAKEKETGLEKRITIENAISRFVYQALRQAHDRIAAIFGESLAEESLPDQDDVTPAHRQLVRAHALIEKAERMLDQSSPEDREDMANLLETLRDAITAKDFAALSEAADALSDILYYLET